MKKYGVMALALLGALAAGCSREPPPADGKDEQPDTSGMADMPGMDMGPGTRDSTREIALTAAQVGHGNIRWAAAEGPEASPEGQALASMVASLPGQLGPDEDRTARLGAPAEGRVLAVRVSPGDRIRRGQVLVTLQSPAAAMAQSDLSKALSAVSSKRAQAKYATSARERAERLLALKAIPRQDYERAVADDQLAQSELAQAESEVRRTRATAAALGATEASGGEIALRAPQNGVVLERAAVPGTVVEAGAPLIVVTDPSNLWLSVDAPEAAVGLLQTGLMLRFTVPAYPADTFAARITAVGAGLDRATRRLPIRASVANAAGKLKPAMLAAVEVPVPLRAGDTSTKASGRGGAVALPADAVQLFRGAPTVFIAMPDGKGGAHFMARSVEIIARAGGRVTIAGSIAPGDLVVTQGAFAVKAALEKGSMPRMEM
jgi:cobalt-zinc-cadmium efflux system membrane fusion protein